MTSSILIRNGVVLSMEPRSAALDPGWVRVCGSVIDGVGAGEPTLSELDVDVIDARGGLVMPGLISSHQHLLDILLRGGLHTGPRFEDWLLGLYYAGISVYTPEDAGLATLLASVETVRAGVTCVVDNWGVDCGDSPARVRECADASIAALTRSGLRVIFARMFATRLPEPWSALRLPFDPARLVTSVDDAFTAIEDLIATHHLSAGGRIQVCPSPELPEMVEPEALNLAMQLAATHNTVLPMHLMASPDSRRSYPADKLQELGVLAPRLLGAHCTAALPTDLLRLAAHDVKIAHCPTSNSFAGQIAPLRSFLEAGLTVGLGSDNATLNCNSDILAETRRAVLHARIAGAPAAAVTPRRAVEMATIEGARAIGMQASTGSLVAGKAADLIILDTSQAHWWPRHDWFSALVFQAKSSDVHTVLVDGRILLRDRQLAAMDPAEEHGLGVAAQEASVAIMQRAGLRPVQPAG